jgi:hypothetical protein
MAENQDVSKDMQEVLNTLVRRENMCMCVRVRVFFQECDRRVRRRGQEKIAPSANPVPFNSLLDKFAH